jgi:4-carboxymuconolactone decarboxylase
MKKTLLLGALISTISGGAAFASEKDKDAVVTVTKVEDYAAAPEKYFTGHVKFGSFFASGSYDNYQGAIVNFESGARTNWHTHPLGQTLVVTSGEGRVQQEHKEVQTIVPGDTVWIPAGVRHWHGAAPHSRMSHIAIQSPDKDGKVVEWMESVEDADYLAGEK